MAIIFFSLQTAFEDDRLGWSLSSAQQFLPQGTRMDRDVFYMVPKQMYGPLPLFMSNTIFPTFYMLSQGLMEIKTELLSSD